MTTNKQRLIGMHLHLASGLDVPGITPDGVTSQVKVFTNNSGGALELGDVVSIDESGDFQVTLSFGLSDPLVVGVVLDVGPIANGGLVRVVTMGYASVKVTGVATAGDYLTTSVTNGVAIVQAPPDVGAFARALATNVGSFVAAIVFEPALGGGSSGGSGASEAAVYESLTGLTDGSTVQFPTMNYFRESSTRVFKAGLILEPETDWTEDVDLGGITLAVAPSNDEQLNIEYLAEVSS